MNLQHQKTSKIFAGALVVVAVLWCASSAATEQQAASGFSFEERMITNRDGMQLHTVYMRPEQPAAGAPIIFWLHGLGQHTLRDKPIMEYMAHHGIASVGFDARGHGKSDGPRGYIESKDTWIADLEDVYSYYESVVGKQLFLLAHSAGTLIIMRYLQQQERLMPITAAFVSAPVVRLNAKKFVWYQYPVVRAINAVNPLFTIAHAKQDADALLYTKDLSMIAADKQDPYILGHVNIHSLEVFFGHLDSDFKNIHMITTPLHIFLAGDDFLLDNAGTNRLYSHLPDELEKSIELFEGMRHTLFRDLEREQVFQKIVEHIQHHQAVCC